MIEHKVVLHHLAIQVKKVFKETLAEHGTHTAPGVYNQPTAITTMDLGYLSHRFLLHSWCYLWPSRPLSA